jgi:hypothetical protein
MKQVKAIILLLAVAAAGTAQAAPTISNINEYNTALPYWGVSWAPGANSQNGYYPSFYTGFAMRSQFPERIHVRLARGNQTRVSVILDDQTLADYMYDLVARYNFYKKATTTGGLNVNPSGAHLSPQLSYFNQIIQSPVYGIQTAVASSLQPVALYSKSLETLKALNPGRIFQLNIDLKREFNKWKRDMQAVGSAAAVTGSPVETVKAINTLVYGRINYVPAPSAEVMVKLTTAIEAAISNAPEAQFIAAAFDLFKAVTGSKYNFKVVVNGQFQPAVQCSAAQCTLSYPEFTAIYPTGSVEASTTDEFGNRINTFATIGLWNFLAYGGSREVDNIRSEPYYGFAPKMDYEGIGNGYHNPAVRFFSPSAAVKNTLGVNPAHNTLWAVKRGGVSHGCSRIPTGHLWEMRQIFPVENSKMIQVNYFGNKAQDFDVYDVDGDGDVEVMGVEYMISYGLQGADGVGRREGTDMQVSGVRKLDFYTTLYGARNVFSVDANEKFSFINPKASLPSHLDKQRNTVSARLTFNGQIPLYEQTFEREKVQFYALPSMNKQTIRLLGRVRGCAPTSDKQACGQAAFENESAGLVK